MDYATPEEPAPAPAASSSKASALDTGMLDMSAFGMDYAPAEQPAASSSASALATGVLDMSAFGIDMGPSSTAAHASPAKGPEQQHRAMPRAPGTPDMLAGRSAVQQQHQQPKQREQGIMFPPCSSAVPAASQRSLLLQQELQELQQLLSAAPAAAAATEYGRNSSYLGAYGDADAEDVNGSQACRAASLEALGVSEADAKCLLQLAAALSQQTGDSQQQQAAAAAAFSHGRSSSSSQGPAGPKLLLNLDPPAQQYLALVKLAAAEHKERVASAHALKDQELAESVARVFQPVSVSRSSPCLPSAPSSSSMPPLAPPPLQVPAPGSTTSAARSPHSASTPVLAGLSPGAGSSTRLRARSARSLGHPSNMSQQSALSFSSLANVPGTRPLLPGFKPVV
jgi:hypothetical protein